MLFVSLARKKLQYFGVTTLAAMPGAVMMNFEFALGVAGAMADGWFFSLTRLCVATDYIEL